MDKFRAELEMLGYHFTDDTEYDRFRRVILKMAVASGTSMQEVVTAFERIADTMRLKKHIVDGINTTIRTGND